MNLKIAPVESKKNIKGGKIVLKPGENVKITTETSKNSLIFLLGIDQSVDLLGKGSNIDALKVNSEFNSYHDYKLYPDWVVKGNEDYRYKEFEKANAFIITNALDGTKDCNQVNERLNGNEHESELNEDDSDDSGLDFTKNKTEKKDEVRKEFPETWIFEHFYADEFGFHSYKLPVPDTITSFLLSGFVVHPKKGFGLAKTEKIIVFKDFFVKTYSPYSVKINETLKLEVTVFNYISTMQPPRRVTVELLNDENQFSFIDVKMKGKRCLETPSELKLKSKDILVSNKSAEKTFFLIKPFIVGEIKLKLKATMIEPLRIDEVEKTLLVENEGVKKYGNEVYFKKPGHSIDAHNLNLTIVNNEIIRNTISIEASVVGDIIGPTLHNVDNLM